MRSAKRRQPSTIYVLCYVAGKVVGVPRLGNVMTRRLVVMSSTVGECCPIHSLCGPHQNSSLVGLWFLTSGSKATHLLTISSASEL